MHGPEPSPEQSRWRMVRRPAGSTPGDPTPGIVSLDPRRVALWTSLGALLVLAAWLLPVHWKALAPAVVERAGRGTATVGEMGLASLAADKPGPARLLLAAAQMLNDPLAPKLAATLAEARVRKPELTPWGGRDALLEALFKPVPAPIKDGGEPVLPRFLPESARDAVRRHLGESRSPGAREILKTRELTGTTRFVPVLRPGGQPFEATILLAALLYEGERLSPTLGRELRSRAEQANASGNAEEWENACLDLLALGTRLDWTQLAELLRLVPDLATLADFTRIVKTAPDSLPVVYSAALLLRSPEAVTRHLVRFGDKGRADLAAALAHGEGAVRLVVQRQLPVGPARGAALAAAAPLVLKAPRTMLALKLLCFLAAGVCFYLVWQELSRVEMPGRVPGEAQWRQGQRVAATTVLTVLLLAASEPFMFQRAGSSEYAVRLKLPVLANTSVPKNNAVQTKPKPMNLDLSTILSIVLFAALQVGVYAICVMKIREIEAQPASPQLKLRLMDNEENLFDSGLYVGIAGTAAALVLQVMGVIEANLLAAYSSNLFGIVCVALVKIRHVRGYKRQLILQSQTERAPQPANQPVA